MSGDQMTFPNTWEEFEKIYGFTDKEEIYTNGSRLIPSFRVEQWLEHLDTPPVRHGKWIDDGQYDNFFPHHEWRCSECGEYVLEIGEPWYKFCPNCGARMDEE